MGPALRWLLAGLVLGALGAEPRAEQQQPRSPSLTAAPGGATPSGGSSSSSGSGLPAVSAPAPQTPPMTQRALSVLVLASAALIVYFVIRTVR